MADTDRQALAAHARRFRPGGGLYPGVESEPEESGAGHLLAEQWGLTWGRLAQARGLATFEAEHPPILLYFIFDRAGRLLYIGRTNSLGRRIREHQQRLLGGDIEGVWMRCALVPRESAGALERSLIRCFRPLLNTQSVREPNLGDVRRVSRFLAAIAPAEESLPGMLPEPRERPKPKRKQREGVLTCKAEINPAHASGYEVEKGATCNRRARESGYCTQHEKMYLRR